MNTTQLRDIPKMVELLMADPTRRRVTKFLSPALTVKATYRGKRDGRERRHIVSVTFGPPNYAERQFIKDCQSAGEPFPVKKLQIYAPARRAR